MHDGVLIDTRYEQEVRWRPGERLDHLFEAQADRLRALGQGDRLAIDSEDAVLTYDGLEARANQVARYLARNGVRSGDRVALLCDRAIHAYVGMLAILKLNAAYVPLDPGFPADRIAYICADAGVRAVLTSVRLRDSLALADVPVLGVDDTSAEVQGESTARLAPEEKEAPLSELAYVIYTSGSTGRPKGVAIDHAGICNFVRVAAEVYGVSGRDRVYQGMTVAFDFSVEEIWVPWMVGATLVPKPAGGPLVGQELWDFLASRRITALCCVPTLLATLEDDLPDLRFLLVSGEPCPQDLIARWYRPQRRFLNVYGPTEASVTATWTQLAPDRRVTIGVPLPTYSVVLLDPDSDRVVPRGEVGEICIAGICLANGYLNRPDLTERAFIADPLQLPNNPSGRLYRTGDLGRIDEDGELEYHGRIDLQVKIRGYRIELTEIESVLLQVPGIATAVVEPYRPEPGVVELVAYYSRRTDAPMIHPSELKEALRDRLPGYMVPAYFEELVTFPMMPSNKVDRKRLPPPDLSRRVSDAADHTAPEGPVEQVLAEMLGGVLHLDQVSVTAHFFDDLGANSLLMARFCARVRECPGLVAPVMKDVYLHPTIRTLAAALQPVASVAEADAGSDPGRAASRVVVFDEPRLPRPGTAMYVACGIAQLLAFAGYCYLAASVTALGWGWLADATTPLDQFLAAMGFSLAMFGFLLIFPIVAKWVLVGRWTPREIRVWGLGYLRFWVARMLLQLNPVRFFAGTPLLPAYLRLLGARIGPRVSIHTSSIPACPDLLTIGADSVITKDVSFSCYRAEAGVIRTGPVTLGQRVFVGEHSVLDIDTSMGDDSQLGHASTLNRGQAVPAGERWHGTPGEPTDVHYARVPPMPVGRFRPMVYGLSKLLVPVLVVSPVSLLVFVWVLGQFPQFAGAMLGEPQFDWAHPDTIAVMAGISFTLYFGSLLVTLVVSWTIPRLFYRGLRPGRTYPLYGLAYFCLRAIRRMTNGRLIPLFGDSNYITGYLSRLGYRLKPLVQTGTNFGMVVGHDVPYLVTIGSGTMVSDGLSLVNAEYSSSSFRVRPATVGKQVFMGNGLVYPPDAKVGDNCLIGTKTLIPLTGEVRHDVGLLGSPAFEIPRAVARDRAFDDYQSVTRQARALRGKFRYNTVTILIYLLVHWLFMGLTTVLFVAGLDLMPLYGTWVLAAVYFVLPLVGAAFFILIERVVLGFKPMQPLYCSVYHPDFWRHERFWKLSSDKARALFVGTPFAGWIWRAEGAKVGRRLFDDGSGIIEKSLTTVGDDVTLNAGSTVQGHSLEEGAFKSGRIVLDDGCTVGVIGFVHYGTVVGAGAVIEADAFLMKGEQVPPGQRWLGNPAHPAPARTGTAVAAPPKPAAVSASRPAPSVSPPAVAEWGADARPGAIPSLAEPAAAPRLSEAVAPVATMPEPAAVARTAFSVPTPAAAVFEPVLTSAVPASLLQRLRAPGGPVAGPVEIRLFSLSACAAHEAELLALLGPEDRDEAAELRSQVRRLRFISSRALVRLLLVDRYGSRPGVPGGSFDDLGWWLTTDPGGKPVLAGPRPGAPMVSLAYADGLIGVAVSQDVPVGLDLASALDATDGIVLSALSEAEQRLLARLAPAERRAAFLRMWTVKEAAAKCLGSGVGLQFQDLDTVRGVQRLDRDQFGYTFGNLRHLQFHQELRGSGPHRYWLTVAMRPPEVETAVPTWIASGHRPPGHHLPRPYHRAAAEVHEHNLGHHRHAPDSSSLAPGAREETREDRHGRGGLQHCRPSGARHRGVERHRPGDRRRPGPGRSKGRLRGAVHATAHRHAGPHHRHRGSGHRRGVGRHRSRTRGRSRR